MKKNSGNHKIQLSHKDSTAVVEQSSPQWPALAIHHYYLPEAWEEIIQLGNSRSKQRPTLSTNFWISWEEKNQTMMRLATVWEYQWMNYVPEPTKESLKYGEGGCKD